MEQWPFAGATAALPPGSPLQQSLTMAGCGACLEVQTLCAERSSAAPAQVGGGLVHRSLRVQELATSRLERGHLPTHCLSCRTWCASLLFALQSSCSKTNQTGGVIVTVVDACLGCAG